MGGGPLLCPAVRANLQHTFLAHGSSAGARLVAVIDALTFLHFPIYRKLGDKDEDGAALLVLEFFRSLLRSFAAVYNAEEGLAKGGKVDRATGGLQQLSSHIPLRPASGSTYQPVREAERALVKWLRHVVIGSGPELPVFDVLKAAGDADGNQAYLANLLHKSGYTYANADDLEGSRSSPLYDLHLGTPLGPEKGEEITDFLGSLAAIDETLPSTDSEDCASSIHIALPGISHPEGSADTNAIAPADLRTLSLTRDRDRLFADDEILAFDLRAVPGGVWLSHANVQASWKTAADDALSSDNDWRAAQICAIRENPSRLRLARETPQSLDGRLLTSRKVASHELAAQAVGFACCQTGDFGGLQLGSRWGPIRLRRLFLLCSGNLDQVWATLEHEGAASFFVRGKDSFFFPLIRQTITFLVPSDPADAFDSLTLDKEQSAKQISSGVYLYQNPVSLALRQRALLALRSNVPFHGDADNPSCLDSPENVMLALQYLEVIPKNGYTRDPLDSPSILGEHSTSSTWPFGSGLLGAPLERPLFEHAWSSEDYAVELTADRQSLLAGVLGQQPTSLAQLHIKLKKDLRSSDYALQAINTDLLAEDTATFGADPEEDEEDSDNENEGNDSPSESGDASTAAEQHLSTKALSMHVKRASRKETARRRFLETTIAKIMPRLPYTDGEFSLSRVELGTMVQCFERALLQGLFSYDDEENCYRMGYAEFTYFCAQNGYEVVRRFFRFYHIKTETRLQERFRHFIESGGLASPLLTEETVYQLLFYLPGRPKHLTPREIARALFLTSGPNALWTQERTPTAQETVAALSVPSTPAFVSLANASRQQIGSAVSCLRRTATLFGLTPIGSLRPAPRLDFPAPSRTSLNDTLAYLRGLEPPRKSLVATSLVESWIYQLGGPEKVGGDARKSLPRGTGRVRNAEDINLRYERAKAAWRYLEDIVLAVVGEEDFEEVFGPPIDWEKSDANQFVAW